MIMALIWVFKRELLATEPPRSGNDFKRQSDRAAATTAKDKGLMRSLVKTTPLRHVSVTGR